VSGFWQISNRGSAGAAATVSLASPANAVGSGQLIRLRSLQATLSGGSSGTDQLVVRDGASGAGTIIWSTDLSIAANGTQIIQQPGLDLRASPGNALTVEFVGGVTNDREDVNAQGDYVPVGYPLGMI
jgi:hypothetical protein